jgi:hypothetical protein
VEERRIAEERRELESSCLFHVLCTGINFWGGTIDEEKEICVVQEIQKGFTGARLRGDGTGCLVGNVGWLMFVVLSLDF